MKNSAFAGQLAVVLALVSFSSCQNASLKVSLCEGQPAFDLSPYAGTYTKSHVKTFEGGRLVNEEQEDSNAEGKENLVLKSENGNELATDGQKNGWLTSFRACRIGSSIWVEDVNALGKTHYGFLVLAHDSNSVTVKVESIDVALVKKLGIPHAVEQRSFLGNDLLIDNTGIPAEKMLGILGENNYSIMKIER